ncbi:MAG: ABC transporter permease [Blastocatellia bacterium]|nr:ABC transporter permease [Chloracidobacterium sp.]MBL8184763.1 ABC transporter permease [Blastocatellia bacterium]HNQ15842.1 ABC transporter permease [Pyrinomonadaceae bacterium]HBE82847.1 peptide ABC transporter permease [Blastocatellia bacterium]HRJ87474.1 ABC transporter permease [Pyrinomonadaceae bacterium]
MTENVELAAGTSLWKDAWKRLVKNKLAVVGMAVLGLMVVAVVIGPAIIKALTGLEYDTMPAEGELLRSFPPSLRHPMGTDDSGRDLFARVLQGGRISLMVGIISTIVSLVVGVSYGAIAGYLGGRIDNVMMRIVDIIYAIPYILIVIVLLSVFGGPNTPGWIQKISTVFGGAGNQGLNQIFLLFFALGLVSWLTMARVVRGQILSLKNEEFVLAAKASGVSTFGIIFRHLVPNALGPVIVYATLTVPSVMLSEAFLSFLGIGVQPPYASWGSLAAEGIKNLAIFPWQLIFPGVTMALTLFSLNFVGDGLRDALDPQTRKF